MELSDMTGNGTPASGPSRSPGDLPVSTLSSSPASLSEDILTSIARAKDVWFWELDAHGVITYSSPQVEQILGISVEEALGRSPADFLSQDEVETFRSVWESEEARREGFSQLLTTVLRPDGSLAVCEMTGVPVRDEEGAFAGFRGAAFDVSELIARQRLGAQLFEHMDQGFALHEMIYDGEGRAVDYRFLEVNPAFLRHSGAAAEDVVGKTFRDLLPGGKQEWIEDYAEVVRTGEPARFQRRSDRLNRTFEVFAYRPAPGRFATLLHDITERLDKEKRLRRSEQRYRALAEHFPGGAVLLFDRDLRYLVVDGVVGFEAYGGPEGLKGRTVDEVFSGELARRIRSKYERALAGETIHEESPVGDRVFDSWVVPLRREDGHITAGMSILYDITERVEAERALRDSEERFRSLVEASPDAITVTDLEGRILHYSPRMLQLLGLDRGDVEEGVSVFRWIHPEDRERARRRIVEVIEGGNPLGGKPYRLLRADGSEFLGEISSAPLFNARGEAEGLISVTRDVTERIEQERRRRDLEREVQEAKRLESLGVLAGGIAHDFNNLLTGIIGNAGLLLDERGKEGREELEEIAGAAHRAAELTNQLLAYAGGGRLQMANHQLSDVIREMKPLLAAQLPAGARLTLELAEDLLPVEADDTQLRQAVQSLVANSAEALEGQEGRIVLRTSRVELDAGELAELIHGPGAEPGPHVLLEVEDSGHGIEEEDLERIFDPFFSTRFVGRGLGLAALQGIVQGHRGAIRVTSVPGDGTRFFIYLPILSRGEEVAPPPSTQDERAPGRNTVLLADDDDAVARILSRVLSANGFEPLTVRDGPRALELVRQRSGELAAAVLDITMPGMSGLEVLEHIRREEPDLAVILISGYSEQETLQNYPELVVERFLRKPFGVRAFLDCLREAIAPR